MEDTNNLEVNSSESKPFVSNSELQTKVDEIKPKKKSNILIYILIFILVLLVGLIVYLSLTDKTDSSPIDDEADLEEEEKPEEIEETENSLKTFEFNNPGWTVGFTLQYPQNWEIAEDKSSCHIDSATHKEVCDSHELILSLIENPQYYINFEMCLDCNSSFVCGNPDSNFTQEYINSVNLVMFDTFEEFGDGKFRRASKPSKLNDIKGDLIVCRNSDTQKPGIFSSSCGVETISAIAYGVSNSPQEEILKEMDGIILSLKRVALLEDNQKPTFKYEYRVEAVEYGPDSSYVGFRICDNSISSCTIYGVKASEIAKVTLGEDFILRFNETGNMGAAAGTTYIEVVGDFELIPIESNK